MKAVSIETVADKVAFEKMLKSDKPVLVFHHAKWCGYCIMYKSKWQALTTALSTNRNIYVVDVEQSNAHHIKKYTDDIRGYPTLRVFKNGKVVGEFSGDRNKIENIIEFAKAFVTKPKVVKTV